MQNPANLPLEASSTQLNIYDMKNWGGATTSDWAKQEAQWAKKAHMQGFSHFKLPHELGIKSEATASKRYFPTRNEHGEWEQKELGPPIHQSIDKTSDEKPTDSPREGGAPERRAAFNDNLCEKATPYDDAAPNRLAQSPVQRQPFWTKGSAVDPARKIDRIRAQPVMASVSAVVPINPSISAPTSSPATGPSSKASILSAVASVIHPNGEPATGPTSDPVVPFRSAYPVRAKSTDSDVLPIINSNVDVESSQGNSPKNKPNAPVRRTRVKAACKGCRDWRVKCDGASPCKSCVGRNKECIYEQAANNDAEGDAPGIPGPSKSKSVNIGASGTKKGSARRAARSKAANSKGDRLSRSLVCRICQVKKTACDRKRPCKICKERGWACVYDTPDSTNESEMPAGRNEKRANSTSASPKKIKGSSSAPITEDLSNDDNHYMDSYAGRADELTAKKLKTGPNWELWYAQDETRSILPALSKWIFRTTEGFQDFQFTITGGLTMRQMEKQEMLPEQTERGLSKRQLTIYETSTNDQCAQEESFHSRPSIKLVLPDHLKGFLVDDWENVTKNGQLVELPHNKATVDQILKDYVEYEKQHRQEGSTHMDILVETTEGIREYFDKALARILLYR